MKETTTELVEKFVSVNEDWYVDSYDSYQAVMIENEQSFGQFIAALEDRDIDVHIDGDVGCGYMVKVYR